MGLQSKTDDAIPANLPMVVLVADEASEARVCDIGRTLACHDAIKKRPRKLHRGVWAPSSQVPPAQRKPT